MSETAILFLWVKDRETIFSALLAIAAAAAGIRATWKQVDEARQRRFQAALGRLAHTCSGLSAYTRQAAEAVKPVFAARQGEAIPTGTLIGELPAFPASAIGDLGEIIDTADRDTAGYVRRFLNELQVQNARLQDFPNDLSRDGRVVVVHNVETLIIDMVEIDALLSPLFQLAREERKSINQGPDLATVMNSMNILGFRGDEYDRARASLTKRYTPTA